MKKFVLLSFHIYNKTPYLKSQLENGGGKNKVSDLQHKEQQQAERTVLSDQDSKVQNPASEQDKQVQKHKPQPQQQQQLEQEQGQQQRVLYQDKKSKKRQIKNKQNPEQHRSLKSPKRSKKQYIEVERSNTNPNFKYVTRKPKELESKKSETPKSTVKSGDDGSVQQRFRWRFI